MFLVLSAFGCPSAISCLKFRKAQFRKGQTEVLPEGKSGLI